MKKNKQKKFKDPGMKCDKCKKEQEFLYSQLNSLDFYCKECYDKIHKTNINIPKEWDIEEEK